MTSVTTRLLILGSFPSAASLAAQRYYAHPRNHFWPILQAIWPQHPLPPAAFDGPEGKDCYQKYSEWLLARGLGVWDVYAACERKGSLDSAIQNAQLNNLPALIATLPHLRGIAHNGGESFRHARITRQLGLPVFKLPSSSPANASWSLQRKVDAWRAVMADVGLV